MRRRDFVRVLGGVAAVWPLSARPQGQVTPTIGFLSGTSRSESIPDGFRQGLSQAGYIEGRNLTIDYRWADGHFERLPALADELISYRVALIATVTLPAAMAAKVAGPERPA